MSIAKQYTTEIVRALQYLPIWFPIKPLELGTVGTIKNNVFEPEGNLKSMKIPFTTSQSRPSGTMRYNSNKGVSLHVKAAGAAPAAGSALATVDAGVAIKFSRAEAVVFEASGCNIEAIADIGDLGHRIIALYQMGNWSDELYVVTEIVKAAAVTVLISSSAGASIELKASGKINAAALSLADVNAQFGVAAYSDMGYQIVAEPGLTPLFKAWKVDSGFFKRKWEPAFMEDGEQQQQQEEEEATPDIPVFSQMSIDDLWPAPSSE